MKSKKKGEEIAAVCGMRCQGCTTEEIVGMPTNGGICPQWSKSPDCCLSPCLRLEWANNRVRRGKPPLLSEKADF
jgi:hypothetical protein